MSEIRSLNYHTGLRRAWNSLSRSFGKYNVGTHTQREFVDEVIETNKKNGRRLNTLEAIEISIRKIRRRYE